jgi:hypothetical protein
VRVGEASASPPHALASEIELNSPFGLTREGELKTREKEASSIESKKAHFERFAVLAVSIFIDFRVRGEFKRDRQVLALLRVGSDGCVCCPFFDGRSSFPMMRSLQE